MDDVSNPGAPVDVRLARRVERERRARREAEDLLEAKSRELYHANQALSALAADLERRVEDRTRELERARARAVVLAERDQLTDLPNRMSFTRVIAEAAARADAAGTSVGLLLVDVDGFKEINDTLGHAAGDAFLRVTAARLGGTARRGSFVARLGGDEFAVVVTDFGSRADLTSIADRILDGVRQPAPHGPHLLRATCSIGIAVYPDDGTDVADIQRYADVALYRSKSLGRACWTVFDAALRAAFEERHELGLELRAAVGTRQLVPFFQPIVHGATGRMAGAEVLARWQHPARGLLTPGAFIELAEELGLMPELFRHQLRSACAIARGWVASGIVEYISVNVSPSQFRSGDLVDTVLRAVGDVGFDPMCLTLEITEELLLFDLDRARSQLERLAAAGVRISLDDFGAGYSNIVYLRRLPIHTLKMDRLLTADVCTDEKARGVLKAVVEIARALGLSMVAEGVETQAQARCLVGLGCEFLQGYLFGKPKSERDVMDEHAAASRGLLHAV